MGRLRRALDSGGSTGRSQVIEQELKDPPGASAAGSGKIFLIGFMGAGKSTVGARLAQLLSIAFVDLDSRLEEQTNMSIPEVFAELGEREFRRLESEALRRLSMRAEDLVIATGGGTATRQVNVELMRATGTAVWLDLPFETILERLDVAGRGARPLFSSPAEAEALYRERRQSYAAAGIRIAVAAGDPVSAVADSILRALDRAGSSASNGVRAP